MKKPLTIFALCTVLFALSATLFAQTTTGSSLITQMKASIHSFTLAGDLNPGATGLQSAPLVGKRTGDQLSAAEYNRLLELVGQGGGSNTILNSPITVDELTLLPAGSQARSIDLSTKTTIPTGSTHAILNIHCGVCSGNPAACNSPNNPESITVTRMDGKTMCRAYSGLLKSGSASIDSYNGDMDTNTTYIALENDGKTIKYNVEQNNNGDGEQGHVEILGFVTNGTGGGGGGGWVDVPLTDTADYDTSCDYRYFIDYSVNDLIDRNWMNDVRGVGFASHISSKYLGSVLSASLFYGIPSVSKSKYGFRDSSNSFTESTNVRITKLQKRC